MSLEQFRNILGPLIVVLVCVIIIFFVIADVRKQLKKRKGRIEKETYAGNLKWITLELKIPADNLKSPQAMEQVFASLHAIPTEDVMSFEIVGFAASTHFYIRVPEHLQKLLESSLFSQYPGLQISPAEDYVSRFGADLPDDTYDIAGSELVLSRDNAYPLRTYPSFDESHKDEYYLDPIATIVEVMSGLKDDEMIWLQIVIRPLDGKDKEEWEDDSKGVIDELMGRTKKEKSTGVAEMVEGVVSFIISDMTTALSKHPTWEGGGKEEKPAGKQFSRGENDVISAIENKRSKFSFKTTVRALYIDKRNTFVESNMSAVVGALRQFGSPQLNSFELDETEMTFIEKNFGKEAKELQIKKDLFSDYSKRSLSKGSIVLCTEELATLYHPPHQSVGASNVPRSDMRHSPPPTNLPEVVE